MMIERYVVARKGESDDGPEFETFHEAVSHAEECAESGDTYEVIQRNYEYADSELVYTAEPEEEE